MAGNDEPRRQLTVAELLEQYGGEGRGGARRRHRAPEPDEIEEPAAADLDGGSAEPSASNGSSDSHDRDDERSGRATPRRELADARDGTGPAPAADPVADRDRSVASPRDGDVGPPRQRQPDGPDRDAGPDPDVPGASRSGGAAGGFHVDTRLSNVLFPDTAPPPPPPSVEVPAQRWAAGFGYSERDDGHHADGHDPVGQDLGAFSAGGYGAGGYDSGGYDGGGFDGGGYGQSIDPLTGEPLGPTSRPLDPPALEPGTAGGLGRSRTQDTTAQAPMVSPERADPPTQQLPRYADPQRRGRRGGADPGPLTGPITGPMFLDRGRGAAADDGPPTGEMTGAELHAAGVVAPLGGPAPAGLAPRDETGGFADVEPDEVLEADADHTVGRPTGAKAWIWMIGQYVVGMVLGALLWMGFYYLWLRMPIAALVVSVLATAALVVIVRAIRRIDDLQTTMLAVLVGLVVTISPAVLLLAVR